MRYKVGTIFHPYVGKTGGVITEIKDNQYVVKWDDMMFKRIYTECKMAEIIKTAQLTVEEPMILDEDLFHVS